MSENFNPYHKWLGIPLQDQPPHYYSLLGLALYEEDQDVISNAADQRMAHVRTFQTGKHSELSQQLLNQLAVARLCLLNAEKKSVYDAKLRQHYAQKSGIHAASSAGAPAAPPPPPPVAGATAPAIPRRPAASHDAGHPGNHAPQPLPVAQPLRTPAASAHADVPPAKPVIVPRQSSGTAPRPGAGSPRMNPAAARPIPAAQLLGASPSSAGGPGSGALATEEIADAPLVHARRASSHPKSQFRQLLEHRFFGLIAGVSLVVLAGISIGAFWAFSGRGDAVARDKPDQTVKGAAGSEKPAPQPEVATGVDRGSQEKPSNPPKPEVVAQPTAEELARYNRAVEDARGLLAKLETRAASDAVAQANDAAITPAQHAEVARLNQLLTLTDRALSIIDDRLKNLKIGDEIEVDVKTHQRIIVNGLRKEGTTFMYDGRPITLDAKKFPPPWADRLVLNDGGSPDEKAALAALFTVHPFGNRLRAKTLFEMAQIKRTEVGDLLTELPAGFPISKTALSIKPDVVVNQQPAIPTAKPSDPAKGSPGTKPGIASTGATPDPPKSDTPKILPIPDEKSCTAAKTVLDQSFGEQLAKVRTPEGKLEMASQFNKLALDTKNDPAASYVLWTEAVNLSVAASDVPATKKYIDALVEHYEVDGTALHADKYGAIAAKLVNGSPAAKDVTVALVGTVGELIANDDFEGALALLIKASKAASKTGDLAITKAVNSTRTETKELQKLFDAFDQAKETLKTTPDDPAANLATGRYYGLVKHDWTTALPFLAKADDEVWKAAATAELANPSDSAGLVALGERWMEAAKSEPAATKLSVQKHAGSWFEKALSQASGLNEVVIKKRLKEVEDAVASATSGSAGLQLLSDKAAKPRPKKPVVPDDPRVAWKTSDNGFVQFRKVAKGVWVDYVAGGAPQFRWGVTRQTDDFVELLREGTSNHYLRLYKDRVESNMSASGSLYNGFIPLGYGTWAN